MDEATARWADRLPDGVVCVDGQGRVTFVSEIAGELLQVDPRSSVGAQLAEVVRLTDRDNRDWVACNRPLSGLRTVRAVPEQATRSSDGAEVLVSARIHREPRGGNVSEVVISLRSGRGRERLDRERSDLVATLAHELRSPLTGVKGFVQAMLIRWEKLSDEQKKLMLHTVSADADRLARLISELLDVARIDTGRLQLFRRPSDAVVMIRRVVESVSVATSRTITADLDESLPKVMADPDKFTQVLTNLVENAVNHGAGEVLVTARTRPHHLLIEVSDEGAGIDADIRRQVFTKFWRGGDQSGSGLGLYLARGLVTAHGGTIEIDDRPGGGAVMRCTWPTVDS